MNEVARSHQARLLGIQAGRGAAALLVVFYHAALMIDLPQYVGHIGLAGALQFGHAGVDFFFVLSGFIIFFVHQKDLGRPSALPRYIRRRVTRIFPSYWLVTAGLIGLLVLKHDPGLTPRYILTSLFLVPDAQEPILSVAWTLVFEMLFYVAFALAILSVRLGGIVAAAWTLFIVSGVGRDAATPIVRTLADVRCLQFAMGIAAAMVVRQNRVPRPVSVAVIGLLAFLMVGLAENAGVVPWNSTIGNMLFGATSALIIAGLAAAEQHGEVHVGAVGEWFGGISYLLYLVHTTAVGFTFRALAAMGLIRRLPESVSILLAAAAAVVTAAVLYRFFEQPVLARLNAIGRSPDRRRP